MSAYQSRLTTPADFERAFEIAGRLLPYELGMRWLPNLITPGIANDTMAALLQARDLIRELHRAGYTAQDLRVWLVEWEAEQKAAGPPEAP